MAERRGKLYHTVAMGPFKDLVVVEDCRYRQAMQAIIADGKCGMNNNKH